MPDLKSVVVFCGGSPNVPSVFIDEARKLGKLLAQNNIRLIYGAGGTGMMGALADGAGQDGGYLIGATIKSLYEIEKPYLAESKMAQVEVWDKMAERKISMTRQADAFCVMPGGFGTMDEFFEILTLRQLGINDKPIIIVNMNGFFDTLEKFLLELLGQGFIKPHQMKLMTFVRRIEDVIPQIRSELGQAKLSQRNV